ncbi:MAG TPA: 2-dehydropantoate 2-reductase [Anaerolineales bacterium]|nr:2-dehydropantoate 2-reductase [Anaerolineales bacterium]
MSRIAILGAGAIGSVIGACLSRAGEDVTLVARPAHAEAIRREGLHVEGRLGAFTADVRAAERLDFQPDHAFLTVKTQDVLSALRNNLGFLQDVPLVTFQNGVRSDDLVSNLLTKSQVVSSVVNISATYLVPGAITIVYPGTLMIGYPFPESSVPLEPLQLMLQHAAPTTISRDIRAAHWLKLLFNLNNAFPALTDTSLHRLYADRYMRELAARVIREGLRAVDAANISLASLPEVSVGLFRLLGMLPVPLAGLLIASRARRIEGQWPLLGSTLQSLRRGQPTEVDYLNGEVVRLGRETGRPTPLNARLVDLVHEAERTRTFLTVEELPRKLDG